MVNTSSATQLLDHCEQFLTRHPKTEKLMNPITTTVTATLIETAVTKKQTDPNLKLLTILLESAHMLAAAEPCRISTKTTARAGAIDKKQSQLRGETALGLFAMAAALTRIEVGVAGVVDILRNMSKVYEHLGMTFSAAACLIHVGEVTLLQDIQTNHHQSKDDDTQEILLLWDLFHALVFAMETGDFVRMQNAVRLLNRCHPAVSVYQDVQVNPQTPTTFGSCNSQILVLQMILNHHSFGMLLDDHSSC